MVLKTCNSKSFFFFFAISASPENPISAGFLLSSQKCYQPLLTKHELIEALCFVYTRDQTGGSFYCLTLHLQQPVKLDQWKVETRMLELCSLEGQILSSFLVKIVTPKVSDTGVAISVCPAHLILTVAPES